MKLPLNRYFMLFIFLLFFTSCATLIHGSKQQVAIICDPKRAKVSVDGLEDGHTPYLARLSRSDKHFLMIELEGYKPYSIMLKRKLDAWIFGNILLGGIVGIVIDAATGSMYKLSPNDVITQLNLSSASFSSTNRVILISVVLKPNPNLVEIGQLEKSVPRK